MKGVHVLRFQIVKGVKLMKGVHVLRFQIVKGVKLKFGFKHVPCSNSTRHHRYEKGPNGLQVLPDGCREWIDVDHGYSTPGALLVNLGDVLR